MLCYFKLSSLVTLLKTKWLDSQSMVSFFTVTQFRCEMDDQNLLNPSGRSFHQRGKLWFKCLIKCKKPSTSRYEELIHCVKKHCIDALSIQEHRLYHPDTDDQYKTTIDGYQLITISAWTNGIASTVGEVGLLLSTRVLNSLSKAVKISPCIMFANPIYYQFWSPATVSPSSTTSWKMPPIPFHPSTFWLMQRTSMVTHIGPEDAAFTFNKEANRNDVLLFDYAEEFQWMVGNTNFMKPAKKLWTFQYSPFWKSLPVRIYMLIRRKWRNSIRNCQSYSSFCSIGSDHCIVSCHTCLSLRCSKKLVANPRKFVSSDADTRNQFAIEVRNIPALIWKVFHDLLLNICIYTFCQLVQPSAWLKSGIIPISKKEICYYPQTIAVFLWLLLLPRFTVGSS